MDIRRHPRFDNDRLMQETPLPPYYGYEDADREKDLS
jgi:hypothetical protein